MAEYVDRVYYCNEICRCNKEACDKEKCSLWTAPAVDVVPRQQWVDVNDRLPRMMEIVMTYSPRNGFSFGVFTEVGWFHRKLSEDPTYWMPLPEPPKEDGKDENA